MDPFTIYCETCAARLKVRKLSAIGQRLACPKCGTMILVDAPDGWTLPRSDSGKSVAEAVQSTDASEAEFEEIDQILALKAKTSDPNPSKRSLTKKPPTTGPQSSHYPTAAHQGTIPILPNEQWTAASTKQRRKWLMLAAGMVSLLVLATAVVMSIAANRSLQLSNADDTVADTGQNGSKSGQVVANNVQSPADNRELASDSEKVENPTADATDVLPNDRNANPAITDGDLTTPGDNVVGQLDSGDSESEPSKSNDIHAKPETVPIDASPAKPTPNQSPFGPGFEDLLDQRTRDATSVETNFDVLSDALEDSSSSNFEINEIASVAQRRRVGMQKYFISKPDPIDAKDLKRLDDPVAGVKYSGQLLTQMLAEIAQVISVPVSFDAEILQMEKFDFGYRIETIEATDTSFRAAIELVLAGLNGQREGREIVLAYDGGAPATITVRDGRTIRTELIPIPTLFNPDQESKERLAQLIQQLVAPETWNDENQPFALTVDGENFSVTQHPLVLSQISQLSEKWNTALAVRDGKTNPEALASRWIAASASRLAEFEGVPTFDIPIQLFLARLQHQTGVNVIVDWNSLMAEGWNPNTQIASGFNEPTVGEILDELTHSMDVAWRVINSNTFEITTNEIVEETKLLEFYSCVKILAGSLNPEQLVESVRQGLQSANRNLDRARIQFETETQCFIVVAPESIHRQMEAIINRMESSQK